MSTEQRRAADDLKLKSKGAVRRSIKLANCCGRGLLAKDNRPMKLLNHDTRHFSRHDSDDNKYGRFLDDRRQIFVG